MKEHVEYTSVPPTFRKERPRRRIRSCFRCKSMGYLGSHSRQMRGFFRIVPSPEQGTSAKTRSKSRGLYRSESHSNIVSSLAAFAWETTTPGQCVFLRVAASTSCARRASNSLATTSPAKPSSVFFPASLVMSSMHSVVFEPGAAQRSISLWWLFKDRQRGGNRETAS